MLFFPFEAFNWLLLSLQHCLAILQSCWDFSNPLLQILICQKSGTSLIGRWEQDLLHPGTEKEGGRKAGGWREERMKKTRYFRTSKMALAGKHACSSNPGTNMWEEENWSSSYMCLWQCAHFTPSTQNKCKSKNKKWIFQF